jgi:hypothetical protein
MALSTIPATPTIYIYTQSTHYDETGYYLSNIDLNSDEPNCDEQFTMNNVFVPVEADRAEIQANVCRNILVAAGVNVVILKL